MKASNDEARRQRLQERKARGAAKKAVPLPTEALPVAAPNQPFDPFDETPPLAAPFDETPPLAAPFDETPPLAAPFDGGFVAPRVAPIDMLDPVVDIPDDDAIPDERMTHVERINRPTRGALAMLAVAAGLLLLPAAGWAQQAPGARPAGAPGQAPPLTITEAMLGRCTADAAAMRDQAQQMLAAAQADAEAKAAYWGAYVKALAPEHAAPK